LSSIVTDSLLSFIKKLEQAASARVRAIRRSGAADLQEVQLRSDHTALPGVQHLETRLRLRPGLVLRLERL
jgi:hypothetical protein